jgi:hypothetical protein
MEKQYYAHSLKDEPKEEWRVPESHLKNTAELARQFSESFGAGVYGEIIKR